MTSKQKTDIAQRTATKTEPTHSEVVLSSIRDLREQDLVRDFTIIVDSESFVVSRTLLEACSPYFCAMFLHDTKEKRDGIVKMKDISAIAVKHCIGFMYTGNPGDITFFTVDTAFNVIHAAEYMQLDNILSNICFKKLQSSLTIKNCIDIGNFVKLYPCSRLEKRAYVFRYYKYKGLDITSFTEGYFSCLFLWTYIPNMHWAGISIFWSTINNWIQHGKERDLHIDNLLKLLSFNEFSAEIFPDVGLKPLINTSQQCLELFYHCVFASTPTLKHELTVRNCIIVRNWANEYKHVTKETDDIINKFLQTHFFEEVLSNAEFMELNEKDVLMLFAAEDIDNLVSEKLKWMSAVRWVKHDLPSRRELFPKLIKSINFAKISDEFIQNDVRQELLIKEIKEKGSEISKIFVDSVFDLSLEVSKERHVAILLPESQTIQSYSLDIKRWMNIPGIDHEKMLQIFSLNEKLCARTLTDIYYFGTNNKWILKTRLPGNVHLLPAEKVLAFDDQVYLISKDEMARYDFMTGEWEAELPGCDIDVEFSVVHLKIYIYAISAKGSRQYNIRDRVWESLDELSSTALSSTAYLGDIYLFEATEVTKRVVTIFGPTAVVVLPTPNHEFENIVSFSADNTLISVTRSHGTHIYAYDMLCATWTEIGQVGNKKATSAKPATGKINRVSASGMNFVESKPFSSCFYLS